MLFRSTERSGNSLFVELRQGPRGWAGLTRVDWYDPNSGISENSQRRIIAGGGYWFVWPRSRVGLVVTDEHVRYDARVAKPSEHRLLVQTHVEF